DPEKLAQHPDVDLVTVSVKVPDHYRPVMAAIDAGKHIYCEWPLGRDTGEAVRMLEAAQRRGIRHVVGLQGQMSPAINYVKELVAKTSPDQVVVNGIVGDGAVVSFQVRGGMARGTDFLFEVHGTEGDLVLTATSRTSMQRQELNLKGARGEGSALAALPVPGKYRWVPDGMAADSRYNVGQLYAKLAERIRDGKPASPGFDAAVARHRLLDAIMRASQTGQRQYLGTAA